MRYGYWLYFFMGENIMKRYSIIRNYKKIKKYNQYFVVFIKCGEYYYTYDADAKIMMYIFNKFNYELNSFRIKKENFNKTVKVLLDNHLNVILAGSKNSREYYCDKFNEYQNIKAKAKYNFKATTGSVTNLSYM